MKNAFLLFLTLGFLFTANIVSADEKILNLVGTWEGKTDFPRKSASSVDSYVSGITMVIEIQEDRTFHGYKKWFRDKEPQSEEFSGTISVDNKKIYIAEYETGLNIGDIISKDEITLYYLGSKDHKSSLPIFEFKRKK